MIKYLVPFREPSSYTTFVVEVKANDVDEAVSKAFDYIRDRLEDGEHIIIKNGNLNIMFNPEYLEVLAGLITEIEIEVTNESNNSNINHTTL